MLVNANRTVKAARACRTMRPRDGFTLIEVLVALTLLAIAAVPLFQVFTTGLRSIDASDRAVRALAIAEAALARADAEERWRRGRSSGSAAGGYEWEIEVSPAGIARPREATGQLYHVAVRVTWPQGVRRRSVDLETLRFAPEAGR